MVVILGSSCEGDVNGPSDAIKKYGVKTISIGVNQKVVISQLNTIAIGSDAVITIDKITKIDSILVPVIDKINDG